MAMLSGIGHYESLEKQGIHRMTICIIPFKHRCQRVKASAQVGRSEKDHQRNLMTGVTKIAIHHNDANIPDSKNCRIDFA